MGVIRVLPDRVANQIAAGEVVDRPASVVKELLENALDAGARRIEIAVAAGGRRQIRVADDGCGMVRDDALLAFERHATSKLRAAEDLQSVATLGFRGEALPAIAAVSRLTLETCARGEAAGTKVEIAGGKLLRVSEAGLPAGTAITASDLFFNLPARRKFLKSEATELGHIASVATHYALAYPEIAFALETPQRRIFALAPAAGARERMAELFGGEMLDSLIEFADQVLAPQDPEAEAERDEAAGGAGSEPAALGIFGFLSRPEVQKLNRNSVFTFVNRRLVRDRVIQHAISEAYRNLLPSNAYPVVLLFLELPFSEVDVNVHPTKVEVRFRRQGFIHDAVRDSLRRALGGARPIASFARELRARPTAAGAWKVEASAVRPSGGDSAPEFRLTPELPPPRPQALPFADGGAGSAAPLPNSALGHALARGKSPACETRSLGGEAWLAGEPEPAADGEEIATLRALGQVQDSFIAAAGQSGLWLVDQHAAHERVLFERLWEQVQNEQVASQPLLLPLVVRLDPGRWLRFAAGAALLQRTGFEIEPFGQNTLAVKAVPSGFPAEQAEALLEETLGEVEEESERAGGALEARLNRLVATVACHAAIKIHTRLEPAKMEWLLRALGAARFPMTCPHGRPVLLRYSLREIQAAFKRTR